MGRGTAIRPAQTSLGGEPKSGDFCPCTFRCGRKQSANLSQRSYSTRKFPNGLANFSRLPELKLGLAEIVSMLRSHPKCNSGALSWKHWPRGERGQIGGIACGDGNTLLVLFRHGLKGVTFIRESIHCGRHARIVFIRLKGLIEGVAFTSQGLADIAHSLA
jgi:hypothetical protein